MNNLLDGYNSVMSTWDNTPNASKTLENFTCQLFQQKTRLKNKLKGNVKKVTIYVA